MRPSDHPILANHAAWLWRECRRVARKHPWAGDPEEFAGDLYQGTVERFLRDGRDKLAQPTRTSPEQHERFVLGLFLRHEATDRYRKDGPGRYDRAADLDRVLTARDAAGAGGGPDDALEEQERQAEGRARLSRLAGESPRRYLAVLAVHLPAAVALRDFRSVAGYKKGGATAFPRPVEETWTAFAAGRDSRALVSDPTEWKRFVAWLLLLEGPFADADAKQLRRAVNTLENLVRRAIGDLQDDGGEG